MNNQKYRIRKQPNSTCWFLITLKNDLPIWRDTLESWQACVDLACFRLKAIVAYRKKWRSEHND